MEMRKTFEAYRVLAVLQAGCVPYKSGARYSSMPCMQLRALYWEETLRQSEVKFKSRPHMRQSAVRKSLCPGVTANQVSAWQVPFLESCFVLLHTLARYSERAGWTEKFLDALGLRACAPEAQHTVRCCASCWLECRHYSRPAGLVRPKNGASSPLGITRRAKRDNSYSFHCWTDSCAPTEGYSQNSTTPLV